MRVEARRTTPVVNARPTESSASLAARAPKHAPPRAWPVVPDPSSAEFEGEIVRFEAEDRHSPPAAGVTLFVGSSSFRLWATLARDLAPHDVRNRGFGGARIKNIVDFARRIVLPAAPERVVLFAGSNDIHCGAPARTVLEDFRTFVAGMHEVLPRTRIAFVSITTSPARFSEMQVVLQANRLVREYVATDPRLTFIDVFPLMLDQLGRPQPELYLSDALHPSATGYALWGPQIEPFLRNGSGGLPSGTPR